MNQYTELVAKVNELIAEWNDTCDKLASFRIMPKCKCGAVIGLYFSERLKAYVCPLCLDFEVLKLKKLEQEVIALGVCLTNVHSVIEAGWLTARFFKRLSDAS